MSDQPPWDHNLERQIPGLQDGVTNLSTIASRSGFRVDSITLVPTQQQESDNVPPTRITIAPASEQPSTVAAPQAPTEPRETAQPTIPIPYREEILPLWQRDSANAPRPKRASTSFPDDGGGEAGPQGGKRKRLSDPPRSATEGPSGAFWGTVLEGRPQSPQGSLPIQDRPIVPPFVGPSYAHQQSSGLHANESTSRIPIEASNTRRVEGQVHRTTTLPSLRIRSPLPQLRRPTLPSLREPSMNAPGRAFRDRHASELTRTRPGPTERRFFRSASQIFGRFSPFGPPSQSPSMAQAAQPPEGAGAMQQVGPSQVLASLHAAVPQQTPEVVGQAGTRDTLHGQVVTAMRAPGDPPGLYGTHFGANVTQQSGSRSASGSGVSYAQPSRATSSPLQHGRGGQITTAGRGRRGRRGGPAVDRDQFFECEQCRAKFKRKSDKNRHVRVVHEKSRPFVCPVCFKTFGEKSNMLKHRASVHDDVRIFRCPYCELTFSQRGLCDNHVKTVHDRKQAKYFCEHCGLPFSRKVQLNEHYERIHPEHMAAYGHHRTAGPSSAALGIGIRNNAELPEVRVPVTSSLGAPLQDRSMLRTIARGVTSDEQTAVVQTYPGPPSGMTSSQAPQTYPVPQPGASRAYERTEEGGNPE